MDLRPATIVNLPSLLKHVNILVVPKQLFAQPSMLWKRSKRFTKKV